MKQFLLLSTFLFAFLFGNAQITTPRFGTTASSDNTGRVLNYKYVTPTYAITYAVVANAYETIVKMGKLTGAQTLTATVTNCRVGDKLEIIFECDTLTAGRVVTFSTNLIYTAATLIVDKNQKATICFIFDGVAWIETSRAKQ